MNPSGTSTLGKCWNTTIYDSYSKNRVYVRLMDMQPNRFSSIHQHNGIIYNSDNKHARHITANFATAATYTVTFTESGLPSGTSWTATFNGQAKSSTSSTVAFTGIMHGSYSWSVLTPISGTTGIQYVASTTSGSISVSSTTSIPIAYTTQYQVSFAVSPSGSGSTTPSGTKVWENSGSLAILATANSGYSFSSWSSSSSSITFASSSSASTTATIHAPGTITANFAKVTTYTVTFTESGLPSGTSWTVTFNGQAKSSTTSTIAFTGITSGSYKWTVTSPISTSQGVQYVENPNTGTMSVPTTTSQSITSQKQFYLTMTASPTGDGTLSPTSGWYNQGASVSISETPKSGYTFTSWSGQGTGSYTGTRATTTITMNAAITEIAKYAVRGRSDLTSGTQTPLILYIASIVMVTTAASTTFMAIKSAMSPNKVIFPIKKTQSSPQKRQ